MLAAIDVNYNQIFNLAMQMDINDRKKLAEELFVSCSEVSNSNPWTPLTMTEMNARLDEAEADAREGRIYSSEEGHRLLESKYPWLCE